MNTIPRGALDHLVVAADTLERGEDHIEALLGVRPRRGGKHVAMGTHNSVLALGDRIYLELIAIDPQGVVPDRPRWFDLDDPGMRKRLAQGPRLIHWVARCEDIEQLASRADYDPGAAYPMTRAAYSWRITIPADGRLRGGGLLPTLIQWSGTTHPTDELPESSIRLVALAGAHPAPAAIRTSLASVGLADLLPVTYDATARLAAMVRTPRGVVAL